MGREATCHCKWGELTGDCKALLESGELILRLGIRRRVPWASMTAVSARGGNLVFDVGNDHVELNLGPEVAPRWARIITSPLPSLAGKLGISRTTRLSVIGTVESEELKAALAEGITVRVNEVDLTLICVDHQSQLDQYFAGHTCSGPLWIVYPKGARSEVNGARVRELLRSRGFIDTKIASVSAKHTAIRFNRRKTDANSF